MEDNDFELVDLFSRGEMHDDEKINRDNVNPSNPKKSSNLFGQKLATQYTKVEQQQGTEI